MGVAMSPEEVKLPTEAIVGTADDDDGTPATIAISRSSSSDATRGERGATDANAPGCGEALRLEPASAGTEDIRTVRPALPCIAVCPAGFGKNVLPCAELCRDKGRLVLPSL